MKRWLVVVVLVAVASSVASVGALADPIHVGGGPRMLSSQIHVGGGPVVLSAVPFPSWLNLPNHVGGGPK